MKSTVFIFVPVEATREGFGRQLRECIASLEENESTAPEAAEQPAPAAISGKAQPFWSLFINNPRPKKS